MDEFIIVDMELLVIRNDNIALSCAMVIFRTSTSALQRLYNFSVTL